MLGTVSRISTLVVEHWRGSAISVCLAAVVLAFRLGPKEDPQRRQEKKVQRLAEKITKYAHQTHRTYPTGDVVVSEADLAMRLHTPPNRVAQALNLLHAKQRVERAPLSGYWKLNT